MSKRGVFVEFSVEAREIADKLVEDGDPDAVIMLLNHLAEAVAEKCGRQFPDHGMRYEIFWKRRRSAELTPEAERLFDTMTRFLLS